jgi:hypothetical protein
MHNLQADKELAKQIVDALIRDHSVGICDAEHAEKTTFTILRRYLCAWYETEPNSRTLRDRTRTE